ncbi:O-antigen ligase family protein [Hymenobacter sp. HSC-4F20]|uniref:O-antigen ligase family protein n=1 Tax=Hymenobacter sp. HSC-4F20 TaxID=2864135 RepID=UPI001C73B4E9|nr:O-antigen ligase family protein [Hymenobacter sp. HSC-4F20]MBX0290300.1 O-antigen ligase family protein [Hymenobacter sp. HSC-4F20]
MSQRLAQWLPRSPEQRIFAGLMALLLGGGAAMLLLRTPVALLPLAVGLGLLLLLTEWRLLYYLLFLTLAFSRELALPGGLSMDVPSEPLLLVLTGCVLATILMRPAAIAGRELRHPLVVILLLMLLWSAVSTAFSVDTTKSIKYLLAKTWYLVPFGLGTLLLLRRPTDVWRVAGIYTAGACLTVLIVAVRHAAHGFSFESINEAVQLLYRNHVIYATVLALLLPFCLYGARSTRGAARLGWRVAMGILLFGLITSYTRASVLSLPVAGLFYAVARLRQTRLLLAAVVALLVAGATYFLSQNNYMLYAPDFEKTVFNGQNFSKHLEATYKLQDVSGMERVYRWVAAGRMTAAKPLVGSGPSTFYPEYKRYTVRSFRTYVSENPEKSTTHNYFLLVLAEQGFPGLLLFLILLGAALLTFEHLYHRTQPGTQPRYVLLACGMSFVIILFHLLLNELVEVDKIGSFFFVNLFLLIRVETWSRDGLPTPD